MQLGGHGVEDDGRGLLGAGYASQGAERDECRGKRDEQRGNGESVRFEEVVGRESLGNRVVAFVYSIVAELACKRRLK